MFRQGTTGAFRQFATLTNGRLPGKLGQREPLTSTQNEGTSHDVDGNKGYEKWDVGTSHDVDENTGTYFCHPTMFMKQNNLLYYYKL
ncbi:MAG: hypothetical protein ACLQOO_19265 [Terriglobia bacterium]